MAIIEDLMLPYFVAGFQRRDRSVMADWLHSGVRLTPEFRAYAAEIFAGRTALPPLPRGGRSKRYWQKVKDNAPLLYASDCARRMKGQHRALSGKRHYTRRDDEDAILAAALAAAKSKFGEAPDINTLKNHLRRSERPRRRKID